MPTCEELYRAEPVAANSSVFKFPLIFFNLRFTVLVFSTGITQQKYELYLKRGDWKYTTGQWRTKRRASLLR